MSMLSFGRFARRTLLAGLAGLIGTLVSVPGGRATAADPPPKAPVVVPAGWKPLAEEYAQVLKIEALVTLANKGDPKKYPLPNPTAFQKAVAAVADKVKPDVRKKAAEKAVKMMAQPVAQRAAQFGRLPGISPDGQKTVAVQYADLVKGRKPALTKAMLDTAVGGDFAKEAERRAKEDKEPPTSAKVVGTVHTLRLELLEFWVKDDTTGWGDDEVRIGGVAVRTNGTTGQVPSFALGSFSSGQKRVYNPPKKLADFNLMLTPKYPKSGAFIISVAEADWGGTHQDLINGLFGTIQLMLQQELNKYAQQAGVALATYIGAPQFGPILGELIAAVGDYVVDTLFGWMLDFFEDDLFMPIRIPFQVKTPAIWGNGATHGGTHEYWLKGHGGHYTFKVRWAKVN